MIDHAGIAVADWAKAKAFYDAALAPLGASMLMTVPEEHTGGRKVGGYGRRKPDFWLHEGGVPGPGRHYAFTAGSRAEVDAFYAAAIAAGGRGNGAPGLRPHYHPSYYGAFVFDPDGNNVEAVCHAPAWRERAAMSLDNRPLYSGGCQCGAVRFRVEGRLANASVCHCRMCQKAFGAFYAPLATAPAGGLTWTRGAPKRWRSSNHVLRGFCAECGTPLTFEAPDGVALAIGAFDHPEEVMPVVQWGVEAKLPYADDIPSLPGHPTEEDIAEAAYLADLVSYQHPDHDTEVWPPEGRR